MCVCVCSHLTFACLSCYHAIGYFATYICVHVVGCQPTNRLTVWWRVNRRMGRRAHTRALPMDGLFARISGIIVCLLQMEKINVCDELESAILSHICICLPTHAHIHSTHVYASTSIAITTTRSGCSNNKNKYNNRIYTWWMLFTRYPWVLSSIRRRRRISERACRGTGWWAGGVCVYNVQCTVYTNLPALTIERWCAMF